MDRRGERPILQSKISRPEVKPSPETFPSCRGCGKPAEGEVFNYQGGLVATCAECGQRIPGGFTKWTNSGLQETKS